MITNNRIKLTSLIKKLPDEAVLTLCETAESLLQANNKAVLPACPYCSGTQVVKNGHKRKKQAYLCRECKRSFVSTTNTIMAYSHMSAEAWEDLMQDTVSGHSIDYSAERLGVSHQTAYSMRHKFLMALEDVNAEYPIRLDNVTELDETFILDSYKGKQLPESVERKPRKHGQGAQKPGLNHELICICTGVERHGNALAMTVNRAKPSANELKDVFTGHITEGALALCDGLRGYKRLEETTNCSVKSVLDEENHKFFHLNTVNSFHSFIKKRIAFYRGVATKYLNRYNGLFALAFRHSVDAMDSLLKLLLNVGSVDRFYSINNTLSVGLLAI